MASRAILMLGVVVVAGLMASSCGDDAATGPIGVTLNNGANNATNNGTNNGNNNGEGCSCLDGQLCVTNATVSETCYDLDCPGAPCGAGEVCDQGGCVSEGCAGVACAEGVCRDGACTDALCGDTGVSCGDGESCVAGACRPTCVDRGQCADGLACVDGGCRPCVESAECGADAVCVEGLCAVDCTTSADACGLGMACNPETRQCHTACVDDAACAPGVCGDAGLCEAAECVASTDCDDNARCVEGRCVSQNFLVGDVCAGCGAMSSNQFRAMVTVGSVGIAGAPARTRRYSLRSSTVHFVGP